MTTPSTPATPREAQTWWVYIGELYDTESEARNEAIMQGCDPNEVFAVTEVLARPQEAPLLHCNKCGYTGPKDVHADCRYMAIPLAAPQPPAVEQELSDWCRVYKLAKEITQLAEVRPALSQSKRPDDYCEDCGWPLSHCGERDTDGEPSLDCERCRLREKIQDLHKQLEESQSKRPMTDAEERLIKLALGVQEWFGFEGELLRETCICIAAERAASRTSEPEQTRV